MLPNKRKKPWKRWLALRSIDRFERHCRKRGEGSAALRVNEGGQRKLPDLREMYADTWSRVELMAWFGIGSDDVVWYGQEDFTDACEISMAASVISSLSCQGPP